MAALSLFLTMLLAASALHKAADRARLSAAAARLAGTGAHAGPLLLIAAAVTEATAALCLLAPPLRFAGAVMAALLWAAYAVLLWRRRGQTLDCGCDLVARERPVGVAHILRPASLAALAIPVALFPDSPFTFDAPFAAVALLALWLGAAEILAIPQPAWRKN